MASISLSYFLPNVTFKGPWLKDSDLEKIVKLTNDIKDARKSAQSKYPDVKIGIFIPSKESLYCIDFDGDRKYIPNAISAFIEKTGTPDFVESTFTFKGYSLVEPILKKYGKTLKRGLAGLFIGKHVVDA